MGGTWFYYDLYSVYLHSVYRIGIFVHTHDSSGPAIHYIPIGVNCSKVAAESNIAFL